MKRKIGITLLICQVLAIFGGYTNGNMYKLLSLENILSIGGVAELLGFFSFSIIGIILIYKDKKIVISNHKSRVNMFKIKLNPLILIISFILMVVSYFVVVDSYEYYDHQNYVIKLSDENSKNILHTKNCYIVKGSSKIELVNDITIVEDFIEGKYTICDLCKPKVPSLSSVKSNLLNCQSELNLLMESYDKDYSLLGKKTIAKTVADDSETISNDKKTSDSLYDKVENRLNQRKNVFQRLKELTEEGAQVWRNIYNEKLRELNTTSDDVDAAEIRINRTNWLNGHIEKVANYLSRERNIFLFNYLIVK